jgi:hypothetical protein
MRSLAALAYPGLSRGKAAIEGALQASPADPALGSGAILKWRRPNNNNGSLESADAAEFTHMPRARKQSILEGYMRG